MTADDRLARPPLSGQPVMLIGINIEGRSCSSVIGLFVNRDGFCAFLLNVVTVAVCVIAFLCESKRFSYR
jgi:hypothetical protein